MPVTKVTFSVDEQTITLLERTAQRLHRSKSQIIREAVAEYAARADKLSDAERDRLLEVFDTVVPKIPQRAEAEVDAELERVRSLRRGGGRRSER
jgi:predicted transcriptional regulator